MKAANAFADKANVHKLVYKTIHQNHTFSMMHISWSQQSFFNAQRGKEFAIFTKSKKSHTTGHFQNE